MKKHIFGNLLAVGLAAIAVFPLAACKEKPSATEGELLPPDAEEAVLPSVPAEPLYFGDYRDGVSFDGREMRGYLILGTPVGTDGVSVRVPGASFYYYSTFEEMTPPKDERDELELFMEYNHADWQGLYDLWYEEGEGAYREVLEQWRAVYEEVKDEIPPLYGYRLTVTEVEEWMYDAVTTDPEGAAGMGIPSDLIEPYLAGKMHYFAPEREQAERLTELVVRFGDGSEETYSFGSFYGRNAFQERMDTGSISGMGYTGEEGVFAASFAGIAAWEGSTVTTSVPVTAHLRSESEEPEYGEMTLEAIETDLSPFPELVRKGIRVRYTTLLGVETTVEWDGASPLTLPIWGNKRGEGSTVTLEFTYEAEVPLPDYCWEIESFLRFRVGGESICIYLQDRVSNSFVDSLGEKDVSAMYAAAADGVDIFARERILGNVEITTNTPADDWRFHGYYNG